MLDTDTEEEEAELKELRKQPAEKDVIPNCAATQWRN